MCVLQPRRSKTTDGVAVVTNFGPNRLCPNWPKCFLTNSSQTDLGQIGLFPKPQTLNLPVCVFQVVCVWCVCGACGVCIWCVWGAGGCAWVGCVWAGCANPPEILLVVAFSWALQCPSATAVAPREDTKKCSPNKGKCKRKKSNGISGQQADPEVGLAQVGLTRAGHDRVKKGRERGLDPASAFEPNLWPFWGDRFGLGPNFLAGRLGWAVVGSIGLVASPLFPEVDIENLCFSLFPL